MRMFCFFGAICLRSCLSCSSVIIPASLPLWYKASSCDSTESAKSGRVNRMLFSRSRASGVSTCRSSALFRACACSTSSVVGPCPPLCCAWSCSRRRLLICSRSSSIILTLQIVYALCTSSYALLSRNDLPCGEISRPFLVVLTNPALSSCCIAFRIIEPLPLTNRSGFDELSVFPP